MMELITQNKTNYSMKKTYLPPMAEPLSMVMEATFICASGENLTERNYGSQGGESTEDFWD